MKLTQKVIDRLCSKARQSLSTYKVSAVGFNHKGEILGMAFNYSFLPRKCGGRHAEENLILQYKGNLKTIIICRTSGPDGKLLPIHPCTKCSKLATKYKIKIIPLLEIL